VPEAVEKVRLGPFSVRTERAKVEAFRHRIGGSGGGVPATFPICWIAQPEIRTAIEKACAGRLPLHEGQIFDYSRPLEIEREYCLSLSLEEEADPPRLAVRGDVTAADEEFYLRMETLLRLVAPTGFGVSA
jgi:hypothetical protein